VDVCDSENKSADGYKLQQQQQQQEKHEHIATHAEPTHSHLDVRERREYDPTPLQYQPQTQITNTCVHEQANSPAIDDFDENLFNSLMYSVVNTSAEDDILKNLNIHTDDILALDSELNSSLTDEQLTEYVQNIEQDDQVLDDKLLFEQIQSQENFEFQPEQEQLLRETKENLEKELLAYLSNCEEAATADNNMQLSAANPKHVPHTRVQDYIQSR
jgi:predicted double-glycine peptidase